MSNPKVTAAALIAAALLSACAAPKAPENFKPVATWDGGYAGKADVIVHNSGICPRTIDIVLSVTGGVGDGRADTSGRNSYPVRLWIDRDGSIMNGSIAVNEMAGVVIDMNGRFGPDGATGTWKEWQNRCSGTFNLTKT
ncbi:MAG: hypothetical protein WD470_09420 [Rhodospirillaceae bacterium]